MATPILWTAEQTCSECGEGVFIKSAAMGGAECTVCGHEHTLDAWNLGEGERFEWLRGTRPVWAAEDMLTLHVTAHDTTEED